MSDNKDMGKEIVTGNNAPSIGRVGGVDYDFRSERVKGILENSSNSNPLRLVLELQRAKELARIYGATRQTVRVVIAEPGADRAQRVAGMMGFNKEGEIALNHHLSDLRITYFGQNTPDRTPRGDITAQEMALLEGVREKPVKDPEDVIRNVRKKYNLERLQGEVAPEDHADLVAMYRFSFSEYPFPIEETIIEMIRSANTQVYVARSKESGRLHSVCATEQVVVPTPDGRQVVIREMGDSARSPEGNGLNAPLKLMLIEQANREGVDLVYCESRAVLPQVNAINHSIGMVHAGYLPAHTRIAGNSDAVIVQEGPFGDLNVWFVNKAKMEAIGQKVRNALSNQ